MDSYAVVCDELEMVYVTGVSYREAVKVRRKCKKLDPQYRYRIVSVK